VFVRVESPRSHILFFRPTGGEFSMLRVTLMSHCTHGNQLRVTVTVAMFGSNDHTTP
jgi:hypothetical protein